MVEQRKVDVLGVLEQAKALLERGAVSEENPLYAIESAIAKAMEESYGKEAAECFHLNMVGVFLLGYNWLTQPPASREIGDAAEFLDRVIAYLRDTDRETVWRNADTGLERQFDRLKAMGVPVHEFKIRS